MCAMPEINNLNLLARTASFVSCVPFSKDQMGLLLGNLKESLGSEFPEFMRDEEEDRYFLRNGSSDIPSQMSLVVDNNSITFLWASGTTEEHSRKILSTVSDKSQQAISGLLGLLQHLDTRYIFHFETNKNHYELIHQVYYSQGALRELSTSNRIHLDNDIEYRMYLEDKRVLILKVTGTQNSRDIIKNRLSNKTLGISISVGQTEFLNIGSLSDIFIKHLEHVKSLVEEELVPMLVFPLSEKLGVS